MAVSFFTSERVVKTSHAGLSVIKKWEGFRSKPYLCPAGVATIGYGSTVYPDGRAVSLRDPSITEAQAVEILAATLVKYEDAVRRYTANAKKPISQNQFDALVSFAYNVGIGNLQKSSLLRLVNAGNFAGAGREFGKWVFAKGKKLQGLVDRRADESYLFAS